MPTVLRNGRFYLSESTTATGATFADCLIVDGVYGTITHVGSVEDAAVQQATQAGAEILDVKGRVVLPGFIDGHMHLLMTGEYLSKVDLSSCGSLEEIRQKIREYARLNPTLPRIICGGWRQATTEGVTFAIQLDDLDPRPIYITSIDTHTAWCNTTALNELRVKDLEDPPGGKIYRDGHGMPTGLLSESAAFGIAQGFLAQTYSREEELGFLKASIDAYISAGYTGVVEMAMGEGQWELIQLYEQKHGPLPLWVAAHWLVLPQATEEETLKQVDRAIKLHEQFNIGTSPQLHITGIKIIGDGVVDACSAALREPYVHDNSNAEPSWTTDRLVPVLQRADSAGLQIAIHAVGDQAIKNSIDALEQVGNPAGRHRIEHLQLCSPGDAERLGRLGIIASIQPVHSDPANNAAWPKLLGHLRYEGAFPYALFEESGAALAIGTDAPTAPKYPLQNLYVATTRRSALQPDNPAQPAPEFALKLISAVNAATEGVAYSCFADGVVGSLRPGLAANLSVVEMMEWDPTTLFSAEVVETWYQGRKVFSLADKSSHSL
ncbi:amidohydrolase family protein [Thozetella sp. PMI_491]|nr:amidohydrolase family protein [Thozetella sp. PMI_491]